MDLKWTQNGPGTMRNLNHLNYSPKCERDYSICGFSYLHSVVLEVLAVMCFHSINLEGIIVCIW